MIQSPFQTRLVALETATTSKEDEIRVEVALESIAPPQVRGEVKVADVTQAHLMKGIVVASAEEVGVVVIQATRIEIDEAGQGAHATHLRLLCLAGLDQK